MLLPEVLFDAGQPTPQKVMLFAVWSPELSLGAALPFQVPSHAILCSAAGFVCMFARAERFPVSVGRVSGGQALKSRHSTAELDVQGSD